MPLVKRLISPIELGRVDKIDPHIRNELELVSNHSLANVIRQLSSLSRNAEDMFTELSAEASKVFDRARILQDRVGKLQQRVTQLDATVEEVSLHDINLRKPYRCTIASDQQVVARNTIPTAIVATYLNSEPPPPLTKLNVYREDEKDSLKFYTDPGYFFELWYSQIQKDIEQKKKELKEKKQHKRRPRVPPEKEIHKIKTRKDEFKDMAKGAEFNPAYQTPRVDQPRPSSLDVSRPPPGMTKINDHRAHPLPPQQPPAQSERESQTSHVMNGPMSRIKQSEPLPVTGNNSDVTRHSLAHHQQEVDQYRRSPDIRHQARSPAGSRIHRPGQAPPAPPGTQMPPSTRGMSRAVVDETSDMLPPPPPPPQAAESNHGYSYHDSPIVSSSTRHMASHMAPEGASMTPSPPPVGHMSHDDYLPPPPPSPAHITPPRVSMSPDYMPLPPSPPPPPPPFDHHITDPRELSPPPPPPPIMTNSISPPASLPNGGLTTALKNVSLSPVKDPPVVEEIDERSALLIEIRRGMWNLKTVAETQRREQKRPSGRLDVQTIMDRAFEMRRKAMEDSEEEEEEGSDDEWDDSFA